MALFKNLHRLALFLTRIFDARGRGEASGKAAGAGQSRPAGAEARGRGSAGAGFLSKAPRRAQMGMETIMQY